MFMQSQGMMTMRQRFLTAAMAAFLMSGSALAQQAADPAFTPGAMRAHVEFLADDLLEGRDIGSRGYDIAARYVATRFEALGLKPAGDDGGWFQKIGFQQTSRGETPGAIEISGPAGTQRWAHGTEALVGLSATEPKLDLSAPLVFVGYGIEDASLGLDDYRGLDVKGKIVVVLSGYPKGLASEEGAHLNATKSLVAQRHGAVGMVRIGTLQSMKTRPWARTVQFAGAPGYTWIGKDGKPFDEAPGIRAGAALNTPAAEAVFAGAPRTLAAVLKEADKKGGKPKGFALKTSARITAQAETKRIESANVAALLPGSDPTLAADYVVLSAHLDHIGISPAKEGDAPDKDRINNGALDNAAGIATLLEVARAAAEAPVKPRRSIIFLAVTGEEKGLLGASYAAHNPPVPIDRIVGNVNLDMPLLLYPFTDVIAFGADHSTLGRTVREAVAPMNIALAPDPMPEEGIFTRSDHYMFVKQGIPAVFLATGYANGGEKAWGTFLSNNYHNPGDDLNQPIDWTAAARFAEANYRIALAIANADQRPQWYQGDFFGNVFARDQPKAAPAK